MTRSSSTIENSTAAVMHHLLHVSSSSSSSSSIGEGEILDEQLPVRWNNKPRSIVSGDKRQVFSRQLSLLERRMEAKWDKRQKQGVNEEGEGGGGGEEEEEEEEAAAETSNNKRRSVENGRTPSLTDEDLYELRGSIDLGFGFNEEEGGHDLCNTLPALNLYFAVNRQLSDPKLQMSPSPASTPSTAATATSSWATLAGLPSPRSPIDQYSTSTPSAEAWKICNPGDSPQHVKTRLRHWAQAVACSLRQKLLPNIFCTTKKESIGSSSDGIN